VSLYVQFHPILSLPHSGVATRNSPWTGHALRSGAQSGGGKREGVLSAFGTFLGGMVHVFAAALGISIILAKSALAFAAVKYVGVVYLCGLGVGMILQARKDDSEADLFLAARPASEKSRLETRSGRAWLLKF
jgi:threonine/homoserine/homoserine lactone efflux protein